LKNVISKKQVAIEWQDYLCWAVLIKHITYLLTYLSYYDYYTNNDNNNEEQKAKLTST